MKKIKFRINKGLKPILLAAALLGGTIAYANMGHKAGVIEMSVFSMLATVKKTKKDLTDEEESFLKDFDTAFAAAYGEHIKQHGLEKDSFIKFFKANADDIMKEMNLDDMQIEGKSFDEWKRKTMADVQKAIDEAGFGAKVNENHLKSLLASKMDDIQSILKAKQGNVTLSFKDAAIHTTDNVLDTTAVDEVGDISESVRIDAFVPKRLANQYIFSLCTRIFSQEVPEFISWYEEGDREGALAVIGEGVLKPLMSFTILKKVTEVKKAAGKIVVNEEVPMFRKRIWGIIQQLFQLYVVRDYIDIVTTTVMANATAYAGTSLDGKYADPTDFHAIAAVAAQIETLEFTPDVIIMHPQDTWKLSLAADNNGRFYTNIVTTDADGMPRVMGFRVVKSTKQTLGSFTMGESGLYRIEETPIEMRIGYGLTDNEGTIEGDFDHNRFRIIGELFFHQHIAALHAASFVTASFATMKETLQLEEVVGGG